MKKCILKLLVLLLASAPAFAQTVSGRVTNSADGQGLPGVSVLVKGTTVGTTTDSDGKFSISADANSTLVFSFIGFASQEVAVGNRTSLDVSLEEDISQLGEVVVTALGIEKDTKSLGYSVTTVDGSSLTKAREVNVANSLVGRVAGVNVSQVAGGPGSSSNVIIRGVGSLTGQGPLYVINGVPMDNTQRGAAGMWGGADLGDGIGNINPDDIEDITVLKGATASALYGSRAAGGVIQITTKSGKGTKGLGVELNSNYTFDRAVDLRDFQDVYGHGTNGQKPTDQATAFGTGASWGGLLDGSNVVQRDGVARPYVAQEDNYKNFYNSGHTFTNTISLMSGGEKGSFRLSGSTLRNESIVPNSGLDRNSFNLNIEHKITSKLSASIVSNYTYEKGKNRPTLSDSPGNANFGVNFLPTSYDVSTLAPGYDPITNAEMQVTGANAYYTNPWFAANRFINNTKRNRTINVGTLRYNINEWLMIQGRLADDRMFDEQINVTPSGTAYNAAGGYTEVHSNRSETNADILLTADQEITSDISVSAALGGNVRYNKFSGVTDGGNTFIIPLLYTLNNLANRNPGGAAYTETETRSLYASAEFSFKDFWFVNGSVRQDWFSALDGRGILYPSAGTSFVFTELAELPVISFGKVRASWAQSTSDPTALAYRTNLYYDFVGTIGGFPQGNISNAATPNLNLLPNSMTEVEFGLDLRFLNDRIGLDFAYYNRQVTDEPIDASISQASGYPLATLNLGAFENKGIELLLTGTPIKTRDFNWDISFNFTKNNNKILELAPGLEVLPIAGGESRSQNGYVAHEVGYAASQIRAFEQARTPDGQLIFANGLPVRGELKSFGSGIHSTFGGINNDFTFKGVNLSFLIDFKMDGKLFSATDYYAYIFGLHKNTLEFRGEEVVGEGVMNVGTAAEPNYVPNDVGVLPQNWYAAQANNVSSQFVYDASFVKLRQIIVGYNFPSNLFTGTPIQSINLSFVARNVAILKKNTPNHDPETNINGSIAQGLELAGVPTTRNFGFSLNVKF